MECIIGVSYMASVTSGDTARFDWLRDNFNGHYFPVMDRRPIANKANKFPKENNESFVKRTCQLYYKKLK